MLRTGIYQLAQIQQGDSLKDCYGLERPISLTLYDQIQTLENPQEWSERILKFSTNERGAYKRTYSDRFEAFDYEANKLIQSSFASDSLLRLHDLGVSDGRTACDYYQKLATIYPQLEYLASDYDSQVQVYEQGKYRLTFSEQGIPLELVAPPFVFSLVKPVSWKRYPLYRLVLAYYTKRCLPDLLRESAANPEKRHKISLFGYPAQQLAATKTNFHLLTYNILDPFTHAAGLHVVRAMNVLNRSYFNESERQQVIGNIHASLLEGGLLVSGSNQEADSPVDGGVYRRTARSFQAIESFGAGHQWNDKILDWSVS
jgi:hypothetical protein